MQFVQLLQEGQGTVTFGNFNNTMTIGDDVNNSSSRGPSTPNFDIKPDVTAPGTNIMSTIPMYKADFPDASYERSISHVKQVHQWQHRILRELQHLLNKQIQTGMLLT